MVIEIVFAALVVAFLGWLLRPVFRSIVTGDYSRLRGASSGAMPPSGPDIGGGIGGA